MHTPAPRLSSRRALLRGALAVAGAGLISPALAACGLFDHSSADSPPTPALEGLLAHTVALGHQYDATITAVPALAAAEKTAQAEALAACLSATDRLAPLLGSITAARAAHQEVLQ